MKIVEAKAGVRVIADGGFTCIPAGVVRIIHLDDEGYPYIECREGGHWLGGQIDAEGNPIPFSPDPLAAKRIGIGV